MTTRSVLAAAAATTLALGLIPGAAAAALPTPDQEECWAERVPNTDTAFSQCGIGGHGHAVVIECVDDQGQGHYHYGRPAGAHERSYKSCPDGERLVFWFSIPIP